MIPVELVRPTRSRPCRPVLGALLLGVLMIGSNGPSSADEATSPPAFAAAACPEELRLPPEAECGTVAIFENRAAATGRKLSLFVVRVPASKDAAPARKPPLFFLAGGPGDAAADTAGPLAQYLGDLRADRDLVFADIRGTGRSAPLFCRPVGPPEELQTHMKYLLDMDDVRACREELEREADLTQYTTSYAADDLNDVRAALGFEQMALFGGSYGTRLAQEIMRRHPERVELAVLMGVAPPSMTAPAGFARSQQEALDALIAKCAADADCRHSYPHFREQLDLVLERVRAEPAAATVAHPAFEGPQSVSLSYGKFVMGLRFLAYQAPMAARFPQLIASAAEGDYTPVLSLIALAYHDLGENFYKGLYLSMTCAEDLPYLDVEAEVESSAGTILGMYRAQKQLDSCELWPKGTADPALREPLASDIPVLLISGELDPVTPPANGDLVARTLSHSLHMVLAHRSHGPLDDAAVACWLPAFVEFARVSSLEGLDISCAGDLEPLPFVFAAGSGSASP